MKKEKIFCIHCGNKITQKELEGKLRDYCPSCNTIFYENPLPVASSIVVNEKREVLLVKRKKEPYKGMWCLPIGFAETGEAVMDAALRELKEEAGIDGETIRLIDVDTVDNYFYGSLAIVTYEVKKTGGIEEPGDDAIEAKYFPIHNIPELAWSSNEKAIKIYLKVYKDIWAMVDSFKQLLPEIDTVSKLEVDQDGHKNLLSTVLFSVIDKHIEDITETWAFELQNKLSTMSSFMDVLIKTNKSILRGIQYWLKRQSDMLGVEEFIETGHILKELKVPLPDVLTALALSRKSLWIYLVKEKILSSVLEIYATLELNNRIIFFYDRIINNITIGYMKE